MSSNKSSPYEQLTTYDLDHDDDALEASGSAGPTRLSFIPAPRTLDRHAEKVSVLKSAQRSVMIAVERCRGLVQSNAGLLLVAAAQAFFALMNTAVKKLNSLEPPVPPLELVLVRMGITYICCMTYMLMKGVPDPFLGPKDVRWLLVLRGFCGFFGLFGVYYSLQYLSLSDATVLTFLAPMATALAGYLLLGEAFTRREAFAGFLSLLGVVLIARPQALFGGAAPMQGTPAEHAPDAGEKGTPEQRLMAVGVALVGVVGATGAYTSLRAIGKRAHTLHSLTSFSSQCVIASIVGMIVLRVPVVFPTRLEWLALLLMIGIFGFSAQVLLTMGLQRETAGRGTMGVYTQIIFASIFERIFFHTIPSALSITGTLVILGSALYVAVTKEMGTRPASSSNEIALEDGLLQHDELAEDSVKTVDAEYSRTGRAAVGLDGVAQDKP